jgi:hypothetical protein
MNKQPWKIIVAAILLSTGLNSAQAADPIKIGSFLTVTGPASFLGDPELKTLQLYVESINAGGGINGRPVELIHYDTGGKAQDAVGFVKRLIRNDQVDVIVGGTTSGDTLAVIPEVEKAAIPLVSLAVRDRNRRTGQALGVQGRPHRPHGRRQDFRGPAQARLDQGRADRRRRRLRQIRARATAETGPGLRNLRSLPTNPTATKTPI